MQLGFVIDHSRCIGCHACTVACKSENDVPLGSFRTWVKYTEEGTFPEVRRSFAVLRCNQCSNAPCIEICPVRALHKRPDGIVDIDPKACIGCKACMQACPYDALHINPRNGTAEKCHFCAHRTEIGLAPACAVVCPTEAIVPGDFHDPASEVSRLARDHPLATRKPEAGTGPNVRYREVAPAGIDPMQTDASGGYLWANRLPGAPLDLGPTLDEAEQRARTTYDVDHEALWGIKVAAYLFTKSLAAGLFLVLAVLLAAGAAPSGPRLAAWPLAALGWLGVTTVLLVADLKRPSRFLYILLRPNWNSWLTRGSFVLIGYGLVLTACALLALLGSPLAISVPLSVAGIVLGSLTAAYTGWLFGQARGRVLWMRRHLWLHLIVQALVAGAALACLARPWLAPGDEARGPIALALAVSLAVHAGFVLSESAAAPRGRESEYRMTTRLITHGPFARLHWGLGVGVGIALALVLCLVHAAWATPLAGTAALVGLWTEEYLLVRAGQALPIS